MLDMEGQSGLGPLDNEPWPEFKKEINGMNDTTQQVLELYIEECKIKGKLLKCYQYLIAHNS
mgnify:CR=1 FL=1